MHYRGAVTHPILWKSNSFILLLHDKLSAFPLSYLSFIHSQYIDAFTTDQRREVITDSDSVLLSHGSWAHPM
jgi:hypothetical protein